MSPAVALEKADCRSYTPPVPASFDDLNIPLAMVQDMFLRHVHRKGIRTVTGLTESMRIPPYLIEAVFRYFRQQRIVDITGTVGEDYSFVLTTDGRALAAEKCQICQYTGPAPVSMTDYLRVTKLQAVRVEVDRGMIADALSDLVVTDRVIDQLGPALISQDSLFLYGPSGTGKTSLAERLKRVYHDKIVIPYAVEVDGQIIVLYDPVVHQLVRGDFSDMDPRWVVCERPSIMVGGELVSSMLELHEDSSSGTYAAPVQMKANNGVFIIDDFGRQLVSPRELLNRWIVPLDRRVDYLTLSYGVKFQIPFELMVVFSTNLDPRELADEAFLRRIPNKVCVDAVDDKVFDTIFERAAADKRMPWDPEVAEYVRTLCLRHSGDLRPCFPRDICKIISCMNRYQRRPLHISVADVDRAVELYFARGTEAAA